MGGGRRKTDDANNSQNPQQSTARFNRRQGSSMKKETPQKDDNSGRPLNAVRKVQQNDSLSQQPSRGEIDSKTSQHPEEQASEPSSGNTDLLDSINDLFNMVVDCLTLHLILIQRKDRSHVNDRVKELVSDVVKLKITTEDVLKSKSSKSGGPDEKKIDEGKGEIRKSKEEVIAERKAKAAEAKARKAAAAAAKKAQKASDEGAGSMEKKQQEKQKLNNQSINVEKRETKGAEKIDHLKTPQGRTDPKKPAISNGSSSRISQPFKHVHFDMTPMSSGEQPRRQPSFTDVSTANVHPAFLDLGARCESKHVVGIDAVCVDFVRAFKEFLQSYAMSPNRKMSHDLDQAIRPQLSYLTENGSRPFPLALGNLIRQLKKEINQLPDDITEIDGKQRLQEWLDDFITQNFDLALQAISSFCISKMESTPCILTYSWCPVVERILLDAYDRKMSFTVCILDSPVELRGKQLAKTLCARNIECTYGMISAIGYVIKECRLVLLGCSAILSNGFVVTDRGSTQVALIAAALNIPVLIAAQTFKFVDRVQLFDRGVREVSALIGERKEAIPADLVTALVTELRILPPSSAPAVLKAKQLAIG